MHSRRTRNFIAGHNEQLFPDGEQQRFAYGAVEELENDPMIKQATFMIDCEISPVPLGWDLD